MLLRGLRYRAGRSAVVAALAMVAVAAAVLVPGYSRAASQSVLTDGLASAPPAAVGLTIGATGTAATAATALTAHEPTADARLLVDSALAGHPVLAGALAPPVAGVDTDTVITGGGEPLAARLAYRDGVCDQLTIAGACPTGPEQVLVSARTADRYAIAPGDRITVARGRELEVVGAYAPRDATDPYWGRTAYFTQGGFDPATGAPRVDAVFAGGAEAVQADPAAVVDLALTYPVRPAAVRLDDVPELRADLRGLDGRVRVAGLELTTALPSILDGVAEDRAAIGRGVPVIAVPLVVLAWFVLFLLVAAVTEDRAREIALARLRGFDGARAAWFGVGEVLVLIAAAAPAGAALGLAVVEVAARVMLAGGTHVELRWPVAAATGAALAATALAAVLAARATLRRGVLALLRRVPARAGWRGGVAEAAVVALAAAALLAAVDDRTGPLAPLAPALLAVVAGIAAARLVRLWSRLRLRRLSRRRRRAGVVAGLLAAAQLARRPGGQRTIVVLTVAVALLAFAATAWDVAAQARQDHATDTLGADRVYTVDAAHPAALLAAVRAADPGGEAMAVVRASQPYAGEPVELLAVEAARLPAVAIWRGQDQATLTALAGRLRPPAPEPLTVRDRIEVTADVREVGEERVRFSALVVTPGGAPRAVSLGTLAPETSRYAAELPGCDAGCRLLGFTLGRAGAAGAFTAALSIGVIRAPEPLAVRFDQLGAWQGPVTPGPELAVEVSAASGDVVIEHRDTVAALPAVVAGAAPAEPPDAAEFRFPGFAEQPQPFTVVDRAARLPRAGSHGLLFDLEYAVRAAERGTALADHGGLRYEVWASPAAPVDLPGRLAAAGVPVLTTDSMSGTLEQLGRRAPALGLWLYLLAGAAAVALALGVVLLSSRVGAEARLTELAALRVSGVGTGPLRHALLREQLALLGGPLALGFGVGVAGAVLMLPGVPLVEVGVPVTPGYRPQVGALPVAVGAVVVALLLAAVRAVRLPDRAGPEQPQSGAL